MSDEVTELETALKNKNTSEITSITLKHKNAERVKLREKYTSKLGHDLLEDIEKYMSKDYKAALLALYKDPVEYDTDLLYKAMKGIGSDKEVIAEIISFRTFERIQKIKEKFKEKYKKDLMEELKDETSGVFRKAILYMAENKRNNNTSPKLEECQKIAEELYNAGENKLGTNESVFIKYFTTLSKEELELVSKEYHKKYKTNMVKVIESEFGGNEKKLLLDILYALVNPSEYFARAIYDSVHGIGTSDDKLIRSIVTRCEEDMVYIKRYFKQIYNQDMLERVNEDTSGDYQKLLEGLMTTKKK